MKTSEQECFLPLNQRSLHYTEPSLPYLSDSTTYPAFNELSQPQSSTPNFSTSSTASREQDAILTQATQFTQNSSSIRPQPHPQPLTHPILIPQTNPGLSQPFTRAWAPVLTSHNIDITTFLSFIDNLNIISTTFPPLQILGLAGTILRMVPHHWTQLAGLGINVLAKAGTATVLKGKTEMFLHEINCQLFAPRGLKVRIASTDAVMQILGILSSEELLLPFSDGCTEMSLLERRFRPMKPYIAELTFDVPAPSEQTTILAQMSAWQVERQLAKEEKKSLKDGDKRMRKREEEVRKLDREIEKTNQKANRCIERIKSSEVEKIERKTKKKLGKIQREKEKLVVEVERSERKEMEGGKDVKWVKNTLWVLIENI